MGVRVCVRARSRYGQLTRFAPTSGRPATLWRREVSHEQQLRDIQLTGAHVSSVWSVRRLWRQALV